MVGVEKVWIMKRHFDTASMIVIIITFVLFLLALFTKGFTKDLLLEAGVFLVSVKIIMMAHQNSTYVKGVENELKEIKEILKENCSFKTWCKSWIPAINARFFPSKYSVFQWYIWYSEKQPTLWLLMDIYWIVSYLVWSKILRCKIGF